MTVNVTAEDLIQNYIKRNKKKSCMWMQQDIAGSVAFVLKGVHGTIAMFSEDYAKAYTGLSVENILKNIEDGGGVWLYDEDEHPYTALDTNKKRRTEMGNVMLELLQKRVNTSRHP